MRVDREAKGGGPLRRSPLRAWLVTGPVGRLIGFWLDFGSALRQARVRGRGD